MSTSPAEKFDPTQCDSLLELRDGVAGGRYRAEEVMAAYLDRINRLDGPLHCYNEIFSQQALERARQVDAGQVRGPLAGVPLAIKDNLCTQLGHTTCSSKMLAGYRSPFDATVVSRLLEAGAIVLGKTNLDEFAMGSSTEHSATGPTRNPWDTERVPGGSSGGSAAAVAADLCAASLGSDTGGSIRQPAALCGVVGLKPTYGLVSRYGLIAFASSLDQIGPLTRNVTDAALLLDVIAGHDPKDSTSMAAQVSGCGTSYLKNLEQPLQGLRIGLVRECLNSANDAAMIAQIENVLAALEAAGARRVEVTLPHSEYGIPTYYLVATAEASSNLARYDGVRYGHRSQQAAELIDLYEKSRSEGFGPEVKRRIMLGTYALSSGYYDAYYLRALKARRLIKQDFDRAFEQVDVLFTPTTTGPAFRFGEKTDDPIQMYLNDIYTVTANLAGVPGVSVPLGCVDAGGKPMPVGLQILGPNFSEHRLLRVARQVEKAVQVAEKKPKI